MKGLTLDWDDNLEAVTAHVQGMREGRFPRLKMNLPPNMLKSYIVSVCYPAWCFAVDPSWRLLIGTNDAGLASRDSLACRRLIESEWYTERFRGTEWELQDDQNTKNWYETTAGGHRIAVSYRSNVQGKKGDEIIADDIQTYTSAASAAERAHFKDWWDGEFSNRFRSELEGHLLIVGHRTHPQDVFRMAGSEGWVHLWMAEEFDPSHRCTTPIWTDRRTRPGELLRPHRVTHEFLRGERAKGETYYSAQRQQNPKGAGGKMFPRALARVIPAVPAGTRGVRYWDQAASLKDDACLTAGVWLGLSPSGHVVIADVVSGRWEGPDRYDLIRSTCSIDERRAGSEYLGAYIEKSGSEAGLDQAKAIVRHCAGHVVRIDSPSGEKRVRAEPLSTQWLSGNVLVVAGSWNDAFLQRAEDFPAGLIDELDAAAGGYNRLTDRIGVGPDDEPDEARPGGRRDPHPDTYA